MFNKSNFKDNFFIKRAKSGYLNRARFQNEINFYEKVQSHNFENLIIPEAKFELKKRQLILTYIEGEKKYFPNACKLISAYSEFQGIANQAKTNRNLLSRLSKSYFYKICIVTLLKLGSKFSLQEVLLIWLLYFKLNIHSSPGARSFRLHGDLYMDNIIIMETGEIAFIDFENTFTTKKWPIEEIVGYCFFFDDENIQFNQIYLQEYIRQNSHFLNLERPQLLYQIRFGVLHQIIRQIVQTKGIKKRKSYKLLLSKVLRSEEFNHWISNFLFLADQKDFLN